MPALPASAARAAACAMRERCRCACEPGMRLYRAAWLTRRYSSSRRSSKPQSSRRKRLLNAPWWLATLMSTCTPLTASVNTTSGTRAAMTAGGLLGSAAATRAFMSAARMRLSISTWSRWLIVACSAVQCSAVECSVCCSVRAGGQERAVGFQARLACGLLAALHGPTICIRAQHDAWPLPEQQQTQRRTMSSSWPRLSRHCPVMVRSRSLSS